MYTTLNIQHIESLNEIVKRITNVKVKEIVPDKYVRMADNIELIDIEPKELLHRMEEGKIYQKNKVEKAKENFFIEENLISLREIALRYMMDSVERKSLQEEAIKIMVLLEKWEVEMLEEIGNMADYWHCKWKVVCLEKETPGVREKVEELEGELETEVKSWKEIKIEMKEEEYHKIVIKKELFQKHFLYFKQALKRQEILQLYIL